MDGGGRRPIAVFWSVAAEDDVVQGCVIISGCHVGYLPRKIAPDYSAAIQSLATTHLGVMCKTRVWAKGDNGTIRARVTLYAPPAKTIREQLARDILKTLKGE